MSLADWQAGRAVDFLSTITEIPRAASIVSMDVSQRLLDEIRRRYGDAPAVRFAVPLGKRPSLLDAGDLLGPPRSIPFSTLDIRLDVDDALPWRTVRVRRSDGSTLLVPL